MTAMSDDAATDEDRAIARLETAETIPDDGRRGLNYANGVCLLPVPVGLRTADAGLRRCTGGERGLGAQIRAAR